jgi:hypothetical protein
MTPKGASASGRMRRLVRMFHTYVPMEKFLCMVNIVCEFDDGSEELVTADSGRVKVYVEMRPRL